jgi:tight adherence protein C
MMLLAMVLAGCIAGAGVVLMARGAMSPAPRLEDLVAELHRPRSTVTMTRRDRLDAAGERFALWGVGEAADLEVCERTVSKFTQDRITWSVLCAAPGLLALALRPIGAFDWLTTPTLLAATLLGAVAGWFYALIDLRSDAARARREFTSSLASYLDLVSILMAGGAGVETALFEAAQIGRGRGYRHLRAALSAAHARRHGPWQEFGELGRRLGVQELENLEASMALVSEEGARIRESLTTRAETMRERDMLEQEAQAHARSETMVLPVAMMFAGFMVLIGYPALAGLSAGP